jgi:serine/threonine protein kinase
MPTTCEEDEEDRSISQAAQRLIRRIFVKDASKRVTAAEILEDPWLKVNLGEESPSPIREKH